MALSTITGLRARNPNKSEDSSLSEHLPWMVHVTPSLVLCKDGGLLAAYEFIGVDVDEDNVQRHEQAIVEMQSSMDKLDERYYMWFVTDKRLKTEPEQWDSMESNPVTAILEEQLRATYRSKQVYTLKTHLFVLFVGETGVYAFMENVRRKMSDEGQTFFASIVTSLNPANNVRSAVLHDARQLDGNVAIMEETLASYVATHSVAHFGRLTGWELDNALHLMASPTLDHNASISPAPSSMLDATLASADTRFGREIFAVNGSNRSMYGTIISMNGYPGQMAAFNKLLSVPAEFRLTHVLRCMSYDQARATVDEHARYYRMSQSTLGQRVAAFLQQRDPEVDPGKADLYGECVEAMRRQAAESLGFSMHSTSLTVYAESAQAVQTLMARVVRDVGGLPHIRERLGMKAAFLSALPGVWAHNKRLMLANNEIISNALPTTTVLPGSAQSDHLSEIYSRPMPSLATFTSKFGTEVHFDPFVKQVGHALLVMPTGGGKTTFVNYCLAAFARYPDAQVIIFDRDHSCRILTHLVGGTHVDLRQGLSFNPMKHIRESDIDRVQAREFIIRRIEEGGETLSSQDRADIYDTIKSIAMAPTQEASLNTIWSLLPSKIQTKLHEWVESGPFGYFGSKEDQLSFASWTCIEMREIMRVDRLGRAFLDHAFNTISRSLDGRPTFIYVEEASFALNNPAFLAGIDEWLKTFRKKNAFVWLTVQSPESVSGVDSEAIRATLTDNIPNILLGYNRKLESHRELYRKMFGLTDDQVSMIGKLRPQRDYLRIAGNTTRILGTNFSKEILALVRSEAKFQQMLDEHLQSGSRTWRDDYLKAAIRS